MTVAAADVVIVLTTLGAAADADALARTLVEERLAACVSVLPSMSSTYRWNDAVEREQERQLVIKTTKARVAALEGRVRELHPYETPEFLVVAVDGASEPYLRWLADAVGSSQ